MTNEEKQEEEVQEDPFEWTSEMEFHYNMVDVACSGLSAMENINEMTKKDTGLKSDITAKCLVLLQRSISYFADLE